MVDQPYRYTVKGPKLTEAQRKFYEKNGYVVIRKLVAPEKLQRYRFVQSMHTYR